jgi:hypothetical protein
MSQRRRIPGPVLWTAVIAFLAVLWMTFVLPMSYGLDEAEHAYRAYQLSLGHLYPQFISCKLHPLPAGCMGQSGYLVPNRRVGGFINQPFYQALHRLFRESLSRLGHHFDPSTYTQFFGATLDSTNTVFPHFENTVLYSPVNYVPQTIVFWFARVLSAPVLATLFIARLVSGLVWAALITSSVALMRRWRWLWAVAVLVPTALAQGPSLSSDSVVQGLVALSLAYALRLAHAGEPLRRAQIGRLAALGLALGLLKFPIPLVTVAMVVIVWPLLGGGRARWGWLSAIVVPCFAAAAWWNATADAYFLPYRDTVFNAPLRVYINQHAQIHHILTNLIDMPALLWNTLAAGRLLQINGLVGVYGTHIGKSWVAAIWLVAFALLVLTQVEPDRPAPRMRAALWAVLVASLLVTAFALYLTWNAVGASKIQGIQGRYFVPLLGLFIPLLVGAVRVRWRAPDWLLPASAMAISAAGAIVLFESTAWTYYHEPAWQVLPRVVNTLF